MGPYRRRYKNIIKYMGPYRRGFENILEYMDLSESGNILRKNNDLYS